MQTRFQGEPSDASREERFAYQIMRDLMAKAVSHGTNILGLFVDEDNTRAIKFYERIGFMALPTGGKRYLRMYLYLRDSGEV